MTHDRSSHPPIGVAFGANVLALALALGVAASSAWGCDSSAVSDDDAGHADSGVPCTHIDGRGGATGAPTSLDEAIASGARRICLARGDFAPPSVAIRSDLVIEGDGPESRIDGSLGCREVLVPESLDLPSLRTSRATLEVRDGARVVLRDLTLRGCEDGAVVGAGSLVLERVVVRDADLGVLAFGDGAGIELRSSEVSSPDFRTAAVPVSGGVVAVDGASLVAVDTTFRGGVGTVGIASRDAGAIAIERVVIDGGITGFLVSTRTGAEASLRDVTVRRLRGFPPIPEAGTASLVRGGAARLERIAIRDVEDHGLAVVSGARVLVDGIEVEDAGRLAIVARSGAEATLSNVVARRVGVGVAADGGRIVLAGAATLDDVFAGIATYGAGAAAVMPGAGLAIRGAEVGFWADEPAEIAAEDGALESARWGAIGLGRLRLAGVRFSGGEVGLYCERACSATAARWSGASVAALATARGGVVTLERSELASSGPAMLGAGAHRFDQVVISEARSDAIQLEEGAELSLRGGRIVDGRGRGIEAREGSRVAIDGTEFAGNVGAAIALYDASGEVRGASFDGTMPDAAGRADEIRMVTTGNTRRTLLVEGSSFVLSRARACGSQSCGLIVGDGGAVQGIVRPNCLTAAPGASLVHTVVEQNGASIRLEGDTGWADLLAGRASDLGLEVGAPGVLPMLPELPRPTPPTGLP